MRCKLVAYFRVSTDRQGKSGLGMEAQQRLVEAYSAQTACVIVASFTEIESGKRCDRPELAKAIAHAKKTKARLVIAKLDRLGRNVHFISGLMQTGVDFVAADSPNDDRFVLHIKASVAEEEARKISQRTKDALESLKARGVRLGTPANLTNDARAKGASANRDQAVQANALVTPVISQLHRDGLRLAAIAQRLNELGYPTRTGSSWTAVQVRRVLNRNGVYTSREATA